MRVWREPLIKINKKWLSESDSQALILFYKLSPLIAFLIRFARREPADCELHRNTRTDSAGSASTPLKIHFTGTLFGRCSKTQQTRSLLLVDRRILISFPFHSQKTFSHHLFIYLAWRCELASYPVDHRRSLFALFFLSDFCFSQILPILHVQLKIAPLKTLPYLRLIKR